MLGTSHCSLLVVNEYVYASVVCSITVLRFYLANNFHRSSIDDCADDSSPGLRDSSPGVPVKVTSGGERCFSQLAETGTGVWIGYG